MRLARTTIIAFSLVILLSTGACAQQSGGTMSSQPSPWLEIPQMTPTDSSNVFTVVMNIDGVYHGCGYFFENRPYENGSLKRSMMMPLSKLEQSCWGRN